MGRRMLARRLGERLLGATFARIDEILAPGCIGDPPGDCLGVGEALGCGCGGGALGVRGLDDGLSLGALGCSGLLFSVGDGLGGRLCGGALSLDVYDAEDAQLEPNGDGTWTCTQGRGPCTNTRAHGSA